MPSIYLQSADYATYGVPAGTDPSVIVRASATINAYLQKPEGVLWAPDGNGNPCYMTGLVPSFTLTVTSGAITPGSNVVVTVTGAVTSRLQIGSVLILDRANPSVTEAVIVSFINETGTQVTLQTVLFAHDAGALLDFDMVIVEETDLPDNRMEAVLRRTPVASVISGQGQFGYPRRASSFRWDYTQLYSLLPPIVQFGGPPIWQTFQLSSNSFDANTGRIWISPSIYLAYYTQIRMYYCSGWTYASLPAQIKTACANIVNAYLELPISGNFKMIKQGDTSVTKFDNSIIDGDTRNMLNPFVALLFI